MDLEPAKNRLKKAMENWKTRAGASNWNPLAEATGKTPETIRLYSLGKPFPPLAFLGELCAAIGTEPIYVLFGIEEEAVGVTRIGVTKPELDLVMLFRNLPKEDQEAVIRFANFTAQNSSLPENVTQLRK